MYRILVFVILVVLLGGLTLGDSPVSANNVASATETLSPTQTIVLPTSTAVPTATLRPLPTSTPTPVPDIGGVDYKGYWLKMVKEFNEYGSQTMTLFYQDGSELDEIATFCVRGSDSNTPNGFYFIVIDRPTIYPTAGGGYASTFFSHNFGWKLANRNWYLHPAPWNDSGEAGCPKRSTGGCVNMRPDDFDIILSGGDYINPLTKAETIIPNLGVGTPFVIVKGESTCTYLGQCLQAFKCTSGRDCFRKFTCEYCAGTWGRKYIDMVASSPNLLVLGDPKK